MGVGLKYSLKKNFFDKIRKTLYTLYKPKNPSSFTKVMALALCPASPATCMRIFTISIGFVNVTCAQPPYAKMTCKVTNNNMQ